MAPEFAGVIGSEATPILLAAVGGAVVVLAAREWIRAMPSVVAQIETAAGTLASVGRENRAPSEDERRRLGLFVGLLLGSAAVTLTGSVPLAGIAAAGPTVAGWAIARRQRRYRLAVELEVPAIAAGIADSVAAGGSLRVALLTSVAGLNGPSRVEMTRLGADLEIGMSPQRALTGLSSRIPSDRVDALIAAILSQQRAGGDLAQLLRLHARAARARLRAEDEARSATAQARMTGLMVVAMPLVMGLLVELIAPGFISGMFANRLATVLLTVAIALQVFGFLVIRKLGAVRR